MTTVELTGAPLPGMKCVGLVGMDSWCIMDGKVIHVIVNNERGGYVRAVVFNTIEGTSIIDIERDVQVIPIDPPDCVSLRWGNGES